MSQYDRNVSNQIRVEAPEQPSRMPWDTVKLRITLHPLYTALGWGGEEGEEKVSGNN